jgi:hypothetical protein
LIVPVIHFKRVSLRALLCPLTGHARRGAHLGCHCGTRTITRSWDDTRRWARPIWFYRRRYERACHQFSEALLALDEKLPEVPITIPVDVQGWPQGAGLSASHPRYASGR